MTLPICVGAIKDGQIRIMGPPDNPEFGPETDVCNGVVVRYMLSYDVFTASEGAWRRRH
jgi:hypothetical protein